MSIALLYGEEDFLLKKAVADVRAETINPAMGSLGHKIVDSPTVGDVLEAVGAICFNMGGKTLIEINNFPFLAKAASDTGDEKQLIELMSLLEAQDETKHILFVNDKINKSVKFAKWLTSQKTVRVDVREFKPLDPWKTDEAIRQILQICKQQGLRIEPPAILLLVEHMGAHLRPIMSEVEKLATFANNRAVTRQDVELLSNHNENTFAMLENWLHQRNRESVFQTLEELLLRQHPVQLFALIQGWLGGLFQLRYWQQSGVTQQTMVERTKKHPFKIKMDLEKHGRVPFPRLEKLRHETIQYEMKAKTGGLPPNLALELLLSQ